MSFNSLPFGRLVCIVCLLLPSFIFAQDYRPGYVIKNNKDSVSGFISYAAEKKNSKYCKFRPTRRGKSEVFTPNDLLAYGFNGDKQYESMTIADLSVKKKVFVKVLARGPLQLYQYQKSFLARKDSLILLPSPKSKVIETSQGLRSKEDARFIGLMNFLISDCNLSANETRYTEFELTNLVNNYNRCKGVEPFYKKPKPIFRANYSLTAGYVQSNLEVEVDDPLMSGLVHTQFKTSNTVVGGLGVDLSSPRIFDRVFFTLDLFYVKDFYQAYDQRTQSTTTIHRDITMDFTSIKMPFGFKYNFLKDANTPHVKAGFFLGFLVDSKIKVIEERQEVYGQVTTSQKDDGFDLQNRPKGFWVAAGYNKKLFVNLQLFGEVRYDQGEGFIGTGIQSFSHVKNFSFMLGLRF
jgi:hypothetical protein